LAVSLYPKQVDLWSGVGCNQGCGNFDCSTRVVWEEERNDDDEVMSLM
jgi:hypothetical protein